MNRLEFVKHIDDNSIPFTVIQYFDQLMGLYNLVRDYMISSIKINDDTINLSIKFANPNEANKAYTTIPNEICMYNSQMKLIKCIKDNDIDITLYN